MVQREEMGSESVTRKKKAKSKSPWYEPQVAMVKATMLKEAEGRAKYYADAHEKVLGDLKKLREEFETTAALIAAYVKEKVVFQDKIADLEERLKRAENRLSDSLEATTAASEAARSIARITNSLGMCIDTLETKLDNENKDKARRFRS
jgi:septal ring factor EnvC (AmiA/AmiB activator)